MTVHICIGSDETKKESKGGHRERKVKKPKDWTLGPFSGQRSVSQEPREAGEWVLWEPHEERKWSEAEGAIQCVTWCL